MKSKTELFIKEHGEDNYNLIFDVIHGNTTSPRVEIIELKRDNIGNSEGRVNLYFKEDVNFEDPLEVDFVSNNWCCDTIFDY